MRAEGAALKQIAAELDVSTATVSRWVRGAMTTLGVSGSGDLVRVVLGSAPVIPGCLSAAEREVVEGALRGESNAEIARRRGRSARTIANQLASAYRKLRVASRTEIAAVMARPAAA